MSRPAQPVRQSQPTCRQRPSSTPTGPKDDPLEISHACRLRKKLACDTHRLVINVWGVGLRLIDG
jgi:hypothetical protein